MSRVFAIMYSNYGFFRGLPRSRLARGVGNSKRLDGIGRPKHLTGRSVVSHVELHERRDCLVFNLIHLNVSK